MVGYAGSQLDNDYGSIIIGAQFGDVADVNGKISLANVAPIAEGELTADDLIGNITFQLLNNFGGTVEGSDRIWNGTKWTDESGVDMSSDSYDAGQGLCVYNAADPDVGKVLFRTSGQVNEFDVIVKLDDDFGSVLIANPYPSQVKLSSMIPTSDSEDIAGNVTFQKVNNFGGTIEGSDRIWNGTKWTMEDGSDASDEVLAPGEGICVYNSVDPEDGLVTLRFTAPKIN